MTKRISSTLAYSLATTALAGFTSGALAQTVQDVEPPASVDVTSNEDESAIAEPGRLSEIVVTATRRATNLQETPVAVTAVSEELIEQTAPRDLGDLAAFVPNFSAARVPSFNAASFAMRGVGQTAIILYNEAPVGVLVDDFVVPSIQTQLLDTFDISQVEVLRGPQGTLFGKNTTGGAVIVRTKRPDLNERVVEGRVMAGSFGTRALKASVDIPIIPGELGIRLVGSYDKSQGYMRNGACYGPITPLVPSPYAGATGCGDGSRVGGQDAFNARAKLLWKPSRAVTALLQYEILRDRSDSPVVVNETLPGDTRLVFGRLGLTREPGDPLLRGGLSNRDDALLEMSKGHRINVDGVYANVDIDVGPGTITSVSGYRSQKSRLPNSYTGEVGPVSLFDANRVDDRHTWQQEVRFASAFKGPLNIVAGGFYQKDKIDFCVAQATATSKPFAETPAVRHASLPFPALRELTDPIFSTCGREHLRSRRLEVLEVGSPPAPINSASRTGQVPRGCF